MTTAKTKADYEDYWANYFSHLDSLAPHPANSYAEHFSKARIVTSYTCKDGVLFHFGEGDTLSFSHKTSSLSVKALLNNLTNPVTLNFDEFPPDFDNGPLVINEISPGKPIPQPVTLFARVFWLLGERFSLTKDDALSRAETDQKEQRTVNYFHGPTPPRPDHG